MAEARSPGTLYLIPTQLSDPLRVEQVLPAAVAAQALALDHFIAENAKTARAFLKALGTLRPLQNISIVEIDKHRDQRSASHDSVETDRLLAPLRAGFDVGLVSEAGAPAVADPGALVVAAAHREEIKVRPLVGPSAILLALMASGLNGQRFCFQGYLPQERAARLKALQALELESANGTTQIFIETPYRNASLFGDMLTALAPSTRLCVAQDLTGSNETISTRVVSDWKRRQLPTDARRPAIFLFLAQSARK